MKLVRQSKLYYQEGKSDKVYEVDLCEAGEGEFLVNFRYGRRGARLREGTKTPFPEPLAKAEQIFSQLVNSKLVKGYLQVGEEGTPQSAEPSTKKEAVEEVARSQDPRHQAIVARLESNRFESWERSRVLWRVGELRVKDAVPALLNVAREEALTAMEAVSLAWALGRTAGVEALPVLESLGHSQPDHPEVLRMTAEARMAVCDEEGRKQLGQGIVAGLPEHLRQAIEAGVRHEIEGAILTLLTPEQPNEELASQLYLAARSHVPLREGLFNALKKMATGKGYFHFLRRIFKAAEFRLDAEYYGLLASRWELDRDFGSPRWQWNRKTRRYQKLDAPVFSAATRNYLRRRIIRSLDGAGKIGDTETFITLATGVLLAFDERDGGEVVREATYSWDSAVRNYRRRDIIFPTFATCHSLMWILHRESPRHERGSSLRWRLRSDVSEGAAATTREEAYPELWDQAPDALMHLLRFARVEAIHEFAVRAWRANPGFEKEADIPFIRDLLKSSYAVTRGLGLDLVQERWDPKQPNGELLLALLDCPEDEARELGVGWMRDVASVLFQEIVFLSSLALNLYPDVQTAAQELLRQHRVDEETRQALVTRTIAGLLSLDAEEEGEENDRRARQAASFLWLAASDELSSLDFAPIGGLAAHPLEGVQFLAAEILVRHQSPPTEVPDELLLAPLSSPFASVRELGVEVLGRLESKELSQRGEVLANCAISEHAELRQLVTPLLERLSEEDPSFADELVERFYPVLLRKESYQGLHDDLLKTLLGPLREHLRAVPVEYFPRMLDSKYKAAQGLGFAILKSACELSEIALSQRMKWASHDLVALREHMREHFTKSPQDLIDNLGTASVLAESSWEDAQEWAFTFFSEQVPEEAWTADDLVAICDSVQPRVQDFGRALLTKRFQEVDGPFYLLRLSEHPAAEIQNFATSYLDRFASGEPTRILELEPYFRALFGRINAGRVAKNRVVAFLQKESLISEQVARLSIELAAHYSATVSVRDRAAYLEMLLALKQRWPDLPNPLTVHAAPLHAVTIDVS